MPCHLFLDFFEFVTAHDLGQDRQQVAAALTGEHLAFAGAVGETQFQAHQKPRSS